MALSLKEMRAKMEQKETNSTFQAHTGNSNIFRFGELKPGDEVRIRFVEDKDPNNSFFWRERHTRTLRFDSLLLPDGNIVQQDCFVSVPAFNLKSNETNFDDLPQEYLYKSTEDVIQQKIKGFWVDGDKTSQTLYNKFGKKTTYLFQGFIHSPGYEPHLYRFVVNKDLFNLIKTFMNDSEIEDVPCDVQNGRDFILKVSEKNVVINGTNRKVKDYVTQSKWSGKVSPLSGTEMAYLSEHGAFDLKEFLPKRPSATQEEVMFAMYNAMYDGQPYDIKNWASVYRPDNVRLDDNGNVQSHEGNRTANIQRDIPTQPQMEYNVGTTSWGNYTQPMQQPQMLVQQPVQQVQMQQPQVMVQQPVQQVQMQQPQMLVDSPMVVQQPQVMVQQPVQQRPQTAPQIASGVTEQVQSTNATDTINTIMSKLNLNM